MLSPMKKGRVVLGPVLEENDDETEKIAVRAAQATSKALQSPMRAGKTKTSVADSKARSAPASAAVSAPTSSHASSSAPTQEAAKIMSVNDLLDMYTSIVKLSTENKINQKNSWSLGLIDHMGGLVEEEDGDTDFMRASATLEVFYRFIFYFFNINLTFFFF
jgi:condensin complex subunit 2